MKPQTALHGPLEIGKLAGEAARQGLPFLFHLTALVSISIAILNLLPIPVLDGGQIFVLLVEAADPPRPLAAAQGSDQHGGARLHRAADGDGDLLRRAPRLLLEAAADAGGRPQRAAGGAPLAGARAPAPPLPAPSPAR